MIKGKDSSRRCIVVVAIVTLVLMNLWQNAASAQSPNNTGRQVNVLKSRVFFLPVSIDQANQSRIKEVAIYMRDGPAPGPWERVATASPTEINIRCQVPHDGEFSFHVVSIDLQNRPSMSMEEFDRLPPALTVIVNAGPAQSKTVYPLAPGHVDPDPAVTSLPSRSVFELPNFPVPTFPAVGQNAAAIPTTFNQVPKATPSESCPAPSPQAPTNRLFNSTKVGIDYNVGRSGTSGVAKIDVWITSDNGRNWQRIGEGTPQHKQIPVDFPGDGIFGVRLVGTNGNCVGGKAPAPGDQPALILEIDTTEPHIQSLETEPVFAKSVIDIRWKVTDKNLANEPISLFFAPQRTGPWQPIAVKVKNDGVYHWIFPREMHNQIYFRLEAIDAAGNVGRVDTQVPVQFDMTIPEIEVTGAQPLQRPQPPR